jgi:hypothetical protein
MAIKLTPEEIMQCHAGVGFALKDFRASKADVIEERIMTKREADQQEQRLIDLKQKLTDLYYEQGGE